MIFSKGQTLYATDLNQAIADATAASRNASRMQLSWPVGATVSNGTVYFTIDAPYPGRINYLKHFCNTGSFTVAVQIGGANVTGLTGITPGGAAMSTNATGNNTFAAGQTISGAITGATGSPADAVLSLGVTWS